MAIPFLFSIGFVIAAIAAMLANRYGALPSSMRMIEFLLVAATLLGPVLAFQAQKWVERCNRASSPKILDFRASRGRPSVNGTVAHQVISTEGGDFA